MLVGVTLRWMTDCSCTWLQGTGNVDGNAEAVTPVEHAGHAEAAG